MSFVQNESKWRGGKLGLGVAAALERSSEEQWQLRCQAIAEMAADSGYVDPWEAYRRGADIWETSYSGNADWWEEYLCDGAFP